MSKTEQHLQRQTPILDSIKSSVAKITQGGVSSDLTSVQQVGIFGSDGSDWKACAVNSSGHLQVDIDMATDGLATQATLADLDTRIGDSIHAGNQTFGETQSGRIMVTSMGRDASGATMRAISIDGDGHQQVDVLSSALPTGASTSALQGTANGHLSTISGDTTSLDGKVTTCNTGAVVISSSALPSGASTSALQTSGNTTLTSIDTRIADSVNAGSTTFGEAASGRIVTYSFGRDASGGNMKAISIDGDGHQQVDVLSSALPSGASTSALQGTANTSLATIAGDTTSLDSKLILPAALTSGGSLKTAILEDSSKTFATSTLMSTVTIAGGANTNSSTLDLGTTNPPDDVMFMVTNSASKSAIYTVHISPDNSNFFEFQPTALSASSRGTFFFSLKHHLNTSPMRYMRVNVSNTSGDSSNYSIVAGHYSD